MGEVSRRLVATTMASPVGSLRLVAGERGLVAILWPDDRPGRVPLGPWVDCRDDPVLRRAQTQLEDYFAGATAFDLPLDLRGSSFQIAVWQALLAIPYGATTSYAALAASLGKAGAARAVGAAVGRNPVSIVVPCHRVVGTGGKLTGFAGGLPAKQWLLALERREATSVADQPVQGVLALH